MPQQRYQPAHALRFLLGGIGRGLLRLALLLFLGLSLLCATFWYRSGNIYDQIDVTGTGEVLRLTSAIDRLVIHKYVAEARRGDPTLTEGWSYLSVPAAGLTDGWEPSGWKLLGVGWDDVPLDPRFTGTGWWIRLKWSTLMAVFAVPPLAWTIFRRVRDRRRSMLEAGYCPGCAFPLGACDCGNRPEYVNASR